MNDELDFHLEMRIRDYEAAGMTPDEARAAAEARLGDLDAVRRELAALERAGAEAARRREWWAEVGQDLRFGLRTLRRTPTSTAMAVLTLALGIGATTAIFSLVWAVLLAPLPYADADRLVRVFETSPQGDPRNPVSPANVLEWQGRTRSFEIVAAHQGVYPAALTGDGDAVPVPVSVVQPAVLRALGVEPALGRTLLDEDALAGDVVVLSHGLWQGRYGGDPQVLGRRMTLNDERYTVVGVMPPDFAYPQEEVGVWLPLPADALDPEERTSHNYAVLARLAPGATLEGAQAEMDALAASIAAEHPAPMTGWGARVVPLQADLTRSVAGLFTVLLGGVAVVLLVACGNLANLLLARAVSRQREMAVRGALGAGRARILRQLGTESALLAALGVAGAVVLAPVLLRVLVLAAPGDVPHLDHAAVDLRMLAFTAAVGLACALLFGLAPALRLSRAGTGAALRTGRDGSASGHVRLRSALLAGQVALSVVLLVGAGLFVRSFRALQTVELGFEPAGLVTMDLNLPLPRYPSTPEQAAFYEGLVERVASIPGVASATGTSEPPGRATGMTFSFAIEGREATNPSGREDDETLHAVTPGYFETLARPMVAGRPFDARDRADAPPVIIINASLARKHFPGGDAVGHRLAFRVGETPWREIVGVVDDARLASPDVELAPALYIPFAQKQWSWLSWTTVVARAETGVDPTALFGPLRDALRETDPQLPPETIRTVEAAFRENTARRTFAMTLVTGFGALALVLVVVGLYGLVTYGVARRRREIGVRMALGADPGDVVGRVLRGALGVTLAGAAVGLVVAAAASRGLASLLFGVSPLDAPTYAVTAALVVGVAVLTAVGPAARAARVDPGSVLRGD